MKYEQSQNFICNIHAQFIGIPLPYTHRLVIRICFFLHINSLRVRSGWWSRAGLYFCLPMLKLPYTTFGELPMWIFVVSHFRDGENISCFFITASVRNQMTVPHQWCGTVIWFLTQATQQMYNHWYIISECTTSRKLIAGARQVWRNTWFHEISSTMWDDDVNMYGLAFKRWRTSVV